MLKVLSAIVSAAAIAAVMTISFAPSGPVTAGPIAGQNGATLKSCTARPWPYLNCVGTELGSRKIRLVSTERLSQ
jgi:hypothetical protein